MIVQPTEEMLKRAGETIRKGGLVAFPTETVYGLGANALDPEAVAKIYAAKKRPLASPLIVHVSSEAMARSVAEDWPAQAALLAKHFWPGPLTIVLKKATIVPDLVTAGLDSVGVRIPNHPVALSLIESAGVPIAAPSANCFTQVSPTTAQHVQDGMGDAVDIILDGGPSQVGIESTVVSLRRSPPTVLRPGMISQAQIERASGVAWSREIDLPHLVGEAAESPGLNERHYAPRTPFYVLDGDEPPAQGRGRFLRLAADPPSFAKAIYSELHKADTEGWDWIAVQKPPDTAEWAGILDRLRRASKR